MTAMNQTHAGGNVVQLLRAAQIVFWDFDGVIKDSVEVKSEGFERLFLPYGKEVASRVRRHHEAHGGMSRYQKIPVYLEWVGEVVTPAAVEDFCSRFSQMVLQAVIDSPWVPGVREYLRAHSARQCFVLLTATPQEEIETILGALGIAACFAEVCGAPRSKAQAIADKLRSLQSAARDALMIGDSEVDLLAANANDVTFLLRCTGFNQGLQQHYDGPTFEGLDNE
jgi:phosphoglycolate phosphatase-like HAD superfamily hydrolase